VPADILVGAPFCAWLRHFTQNSTPTKMQLHSALCRIKLGINTYGIFMELPIL